MYILNHLTTDTYPFSTDFAGKTVQENIRIKDNRMISAAKAETVFLVRIMNISLTNYEHYTKLLYTDEKYDSDYVCFDSECQYLCNIEDYKDEWFIYGFKCYKKEHDFDVLFNDVSSEAYNEAKNYNPSKTLLRSLDENKKNNRKEIKASQKGYYYEDVKEGWKGYYRGYFLIDNTFTVIKQTGTLYQFNVEQLNIVYTLDPITSIFI